MNSARPYFYASYWSNLNFFITNSTLFSKTNSSCLGCKYTFNISQVHGWGHEIKDPSYDAITVSASTKIVIVEGLYVLLEKDEWATLVCAKADMRIFLQCPPEITLERGPQRNYEAGICPTLEASVTRWKFNDMANGEFLLRHLSLDRVDFLIDQ